MATVIVAQATNADSLWPCLNRLAEIESVEVTGDASAGTFQRTERGLEAARRPLTGNYHVAGPRVEIETAQELAPAVVFERLAKAGLHLISFR